MDDSYELFEYEPKYATKKLIVPLARKLGQNSVVELDILTGFIQGKIKKPASILFTESLLK